LNSCVLPLFQQTKAMQNALIRYEQLISIVKLHPEIVFVIWKRSDLLAYNNAFEKYFGALKLGTSKELTHLFEHPGFLAQSLNILKNNPNPPSQKLIFKHKDGRSFWGKLTTAKFNEELDIFYISDIDEQVKLRLNYAHAIQQSPYAILQLDQQLHIQSINNAAEMVFNRFKEQLIGASLLELIEEENGRVKFMQLIDEFALNPRKKHIVKQLHFDRLDLPSFPAEFYLLRHLQSDGIGYTMFVNDITELEQQRKVLAQKNAELIKTNHQLDAFLYSVYHDLRAPVSSIKGLLNILELPGQADNFQHYMKLVGKSADKLNQVLDNIIMVSQNTRERLNFSDINLQEVFDQLIGEFSERLAEANVHLEYVVFQEGNFFCDESRIRNIVFHLIKNAIDFADTKKHFKRINIHVEYQHERLQVAVSDNGIGIEDHHKDKVFDLFYRGSEISKGSGLGLYIVREMTTKLNGQVKLESERSSGTTITLTIPNNVKGKLMANKRRLLSE
jgi:PAS domain S-box-containing protein